ncbi:MAG: efflux RND transporter periplasmic adaptor subunit [Casimicrobiaceae bacterium]
MRALIVAALGAALIAGCSKSGPPDKAKGSAGAGGGAMMALPVSVIEAKQERIPVQVEAVGQAEGSKEVEVRARVGGILVKQAFKEGDRVQAGAVLYTVDRAPFEIAFAQADAALAQQKALIDRAQREATRLKPLVQERAISAREYDDATSAVETNQAQLAASESKVKEARLNLSYTNVTAPISGVTGRSQRSEGSLVAAGTDLLTTISVTDPIWVRFSLSDAETLQLRKAPQSATVRLVLSDGSLYDRTGKLNFAASTVDLKTGLVPVRAEFPNPRLIILPGQFVRVQITLGSREGVLVPKAAVSQSDRGKAAFVVGPDNKVAPRPVETDGWSGDNWVVTKGLENGDKVIVDNLMKLRPGALVAPHPVGQAPAGPPSPGGPGAEPKDAAASKGTNPADKAAAAPGGSAATANGHNTGGGTTAAGKK